MKKYSYASCVSMMECIGWENIICYLLLLIDDVDY